MNESWKNTRKNRGGNPCLVLAEAVELHSIVYLEMAGAYSGIRIDSLNTYSFHDATRTRIVVKRCLFILKLGNVNLKMFHEKRGVRLSMPC